jgi:hypothetical protein
MTTSKLLTLSADGTTAAVADATMTDIFTSVIDTNKCVTGLYGLAQTGLTFVAGMAYQNSRLGNGWNPFNS